MLGILRTPDDGRTLDPQPSLDHVDALIEQAREAGLAVALHTDGQPHALAPGVDLAAYRVVQEALTNVVKHSGGAPTTVSVHYRSDAVEVWIADRGSGRPDLRLGSGGHGLVGMRERVRMYGGELHAGRRRGGGFEVRVVFPLEGEEAAALTAGARA
jgi:signal transduction histidine kinase